MVDFWVGVVEVVVVRCFHRLRFRCRKCRIRFLVRGRHVWLAMRVVDPILLVVLGVEFRDE